MHKKKSTYEIVAYDKDADVYVRIATIHHDLPLAIELANRASELQLKRTNGEPFDWIEVITPYAGVLHHLGYCRVNLHNENGRCKAELVSRLVADAFIPNPNNLPHVGHDDDVKTHNDSTNLYWTDPHENNHHNGKMERFQDAHREKIDIIADKLSMKVKGTALDGSGEVIFKSTQEANRNGFDGAKISMCVNGKRNKHRGYRWERINDD